MVKRLKSEKLESKSFNSPDEIRTFDRGRLELLKIGGAIVGRAVFEPGWKWSKSLKPVVKTKSCNAPHFQYHVSGTLKVQMEDGTEKELKAGDVSLLPPGHDAWVVGEEPVVVVDFQGMSVYGKSTEAKEVE
ncbi:MAG: cupin domain-containing protein [Candidatus Omnitrophica bacterium]|nr:cupin domain-containing protein [Candidatus Omnitrophota bacterium]